MVMINKYTFEFFVGGAVVSAILAAILFYSLMPVFAAAPSGLPSSVATSSNRTWTAASEVAFATTTNCASRIIGTRGDAIRIVFSDINGETPSASVGFPQAASTTVVYDSGLYGCGQVKIYSYAAQVINLAETR